ncbi:hypothetical protein QAD02_013772 [Eretmocerus hayati]|uniref:Uncharacterized protein n=1 Tax=Eretmocerus hayati TaxID=131215 RepID=A0ACC2P882_9HYME|nr:hypothetical protein QAD02_013772 [Eretmocerus hayati]
MKFFADGTWTRIPAEDAGVGKKAAAYSATYAIRLKSYGVLKLLGMGIAFNKVVKAALKSIKSIRNSRVVMISAVKGAREAMKAVGGKKYVKPPRVLPGAKKVDGFLPFLVPLFAEFSATGALAGGVSGIVKTIMTPSLLRSNSEGSKHNRAMELIALGKGLYLKPCGTGLRLHIPSRFMTPEEKTIRRIKKRNSVRRKKTRKEHKKHLAPEPCVDKS